MTDFIVCKFGGSSVADAQQIEKVRQIVKEDGRRRYIVVSAPGRSRPDEQKVTDHLLNIATYGSHFRELRPTITPDGSRRAVLDKFGHILRELKLDGAEIIQALTRDLDTELEDERRSAFLASRGEHYNARIIAAYFSQCQMPARALLPEEFGLLVSPDYLDAKVLERAYDNIAGVDIEGFIAVIPGFYGVTEGGDVAVFSRGGSDLSGGEIAYAIDALTYENWTDVSGVFDADPGVIPEARAIPRLTFKEIRLLSSKGFNVFHFNAMQRCKQRKIPINIRNTNRPQEPGTLILNERVPEEGIVGIARLDNMAAIYLEKDTLGEEVGFTAALLTIFQEFSINTYYYPTDKDDIAVLVSQDDLTGTINDLRRRIDRHLKPDHMSVEYNLAVLTLVGAGLKGNSFPIADALGALAEAHIPIAMIDQSPSQLCFHIGVSQAVADDATRILYKRLIEGTE
ncbi:MAG: aspartate kinase [Gammaproteobacteria bacterium SHHR-1]|uniref:aspartate kinase n=1 Tax=Magnetovirga frankeli TaxID=947516 RepID=UPI001293C250|nr:aspartate kinase [gamma proteobacterium SS-5]